MCFGYNEDINTAAKVLLHCTEEKEGGTRWELALLISYKLNCISLYWANRKIPKLTVYVGCDTPRPLKSNLSVAGLLGGHLHYYSKSEIKEPKQLLEQLRVCIRAVHVQIIYSR